MSLSNAAVNLAELLSDAETKAKAIKSSTPVLFAEVVLELYRECCQLKTKLECQEAHGVDRAIYELIKRLPEPGTDWTLKSRYRWLAAMATILDVVYERPENEDGDITITFNGDITITFK